MTERLPVDMILIQRLTEIIHSNLNNENFGVKELAKESGISQKVLRRKLHVFKKETANQFIREVRLQKAFEILQKEKINASEVAYKVGFSSPAYFNTCFHKYYGYPPGKLNKSVPGMQELNIMTQKEAEDGIKKPALSTFILSVAGILLALLLGTIGYLFYKNINKSESTKSLISSDGRISIAVMPFQNRTNDTTWNIWQEGIQNEIITFLTNYNELKLKQSESISRLLKNPGIKTYASLSPSLAGLISKKLDANVFLYGKIILAGSTLRVNAQLIDTKTKEVYKSFQIERASKEDFIYQIIDSLSVQIKNYLLISILEKKLLPEERQITSANSPEAYRYYIIGLKAFLKSDFQTAVEFYSHALAIDSDFTMAASDMSYAYAYLGKLDQTRKWSKWLYEKRDKMPILQKIFVEYTYANNFGTPFEALKCLIRLQEYDDIGSNFHFLLGQQYLELGQFDQAIDEFKRNLKILTDLYPKLTIDWDYTNLGLAYHKTGQFQNEKKLYRKASKYFPESFELNYRQAVLSLAEGDTSAAKQYIEKYIFIQNHNAVPEADIVTKLAEMYSEADLQNKAEDYYRMAFSLEPDNIVRIRNLSYFLVDKERGINEGMTLADTVIKSKPDDFEFLHIKGWGLYKQGKNKQAQKLLQKSWDLRNQYSVYDHTSYLHLEEVKKANSNSK
jgi:AraC-like DNA-binding protein/TolB-like protein/Tfp pilus assembly protein PilF